VSKAKKGRLELLEADLIEAFNRQIQTDHANPKRIGCPGTPALRKLALSPQSSDNDYALVHIGSCAACLSELTRLRRNRITLRSTGVGPRTGSSRRLDQAR
jgi:hypothetical protein